MSTPIHEILEEENDDNVSFTVICLDDLESAAACSCKTAMDNPY